jgi:hypothetical protein
MLVIDTAEIIHKLDGSGFLLCQRQRGNYFCGIITTLTPLKPFIKYSVSANTMRNVYPGQYKINMETNGLVLFFTLIIQYPVYSI